MESKITLSKMKSMDIPLIKTWMEQTYIQKWLGDPTDWLEELENKDHTFDWIHHFLIHYDQKPIGFCQYFDCNHAPTGFEWDNEPQGTFAIDYFIGCPTYLQKGLGKEIIKTLVEHIRRNEHVKQIVADPVKDNLPSIKILEKIIFILTQQLDYINLPFNHSLYIKNSRNPNKQISTTINVPCRNRTCN